MSTTITFRRGTAAPTQGAGLTLGEPAFDTTNRNFYIGLGSGVTAAWVGARISGSSGDIAAGLTNWIVNAKAVKDYVDVVSANPTNVVTSFNGLTGAVGGVCAAQTNTFTALQTFNAGITASRIFVSNGSTFAGLVTFTNSAGVGVSAGDARIRTISGIRTLSAVNSSGIDILPSVSQTTERGTLNFYSYYSIGDTENFLTLRPTELTANRVVTFADEAGTIALRGANTFTGLQTLTAGLSAAGGVTADTLNVIGNALVGATLTVSGNLIVNGTTTTINSTTISVDDKNIVLGDITIPTDAGADDGGFTLRGSSDKTLVWKQTTAGGNVGSAWNSNQDFNLTSASGAYWVNGSQVLSKTSLGSSVTSSSLTSVGTITSGTWNSDIVYVDGGTYT
jgi:hypothetical protein